MVTRFKDRSDAGRKLAQLLTHLRDLQPVRELLVTDNIEPRDSKTRLAPTIVSIAPLVATAIRRLLDGGSLRELT